MHVRVHNSRYREAYVCDLYACIQMSIYVIASVYVWVHVTVRVFINIYTYSCLRVL